MYLSEQERQEISQELSKVILKEALEQYLEDFKSCGPICCKQLYDEIDEIVERVAMTNDEVGSHNIEEAIEDIEIEIEDMVKEVINDLIEKIEKGASSE